MNQTPFFARLRELIDQAGITGYRLAQRADLPKQTISHYLTGARDPMFGNVVRIARALDLSLSVFDDVTVAHSPERNPS